jgi:hypothetical protein
LRRGAISQAALDLHRGARLQHLIEYPEPNFDRHVVTGRAFHADDTPVAVLAPGAGRTKKLPQMDLLRDERPHGGPRHRRALSLYAHGSPRHRECTAARTIEFIKHVPGPNAIEFFPNAAERYRRQVANIHAALSRGEAGDSEAIALVRALIARIACGTP